MLNFGRDEQICYTEKNCEKYILKKNKFKNKKKKILKYKEKKKKSLNIHNK